MKFGIFFGFFILLIMLSCDHQTSKVSTQTKSDAIQRLGKKTGLSIEYGMNQGIRANASKGITYPLIYTTAIITNDSIVPIHVRMSLSKEYKFPEFCGDGDSKYIVVLLPDELTPDTATLHNNIIGGSESFFETCLDNPYTLNKTLNPGEYCVVTIGTLYPPTTKCEVIPRAVFSSDFIEQYSECDRQINSAISTNAKLEIGVKLEYYNQRKFIAPADGCAIIPCGQLYYLIKHAIYVPSSRPVYQTVKRRENAY